MDLEICNGTFNNSSDRGSRKDILLTFCCYIPSHHALITGWLVGSGNENCRGSSTHITLLQKAVTRTQTFLVTRDRLFRRFWKQRHPSLRAVTHKNPE